MADLLLSERGESPVGKNWTTTFIKRRTEIKSKFSRNSSGGGSLAGDWLEERSGSESSCTVQIERGPNNELVKDVTSNECPADLGRFNKWERGRNDDLVKDATNILLRKRGSLAVGEVRFQLELSSSAGEGL
ncbi:hypothetical protein VC83_02523 [Pseudogymnoascus destructans]|uniref:HTH CENPB-type domain-containing protein n=1 Tax=Pseudogymnoascus destructans TaxID=655981 RepID=A0A177AHN5_9PEZI|nr:uncharacterized protein VC83_02523 [Pseudogymnoascus destructans]OAF60932.1 hypothetical protein VC83_02523 [Pseudogymnoascus destructans]